MAENKQTDVSNQVNNDVAKALAELKINDADTKSGPILPTAVLENSQELGSLNESFSALDLIDNRGYTSPGNLSQRRRPRGKLSSDPFGRNRRSSSDSSTFMIDGSSLASISMMDISARRSAARRVADLRNCNGPAFDFAEFYPHLCSPEQLIQVKQANRIDEKQSKQAEHASDKLDYAEPNYDASAEGHVATPTGPGTLDAGDNCRS